MLGGRIPTAADLDLLPWTNACLQESMRLYPPIWMFERRAIADTTVGDYAIPAAGTIISISPWLVHRNPAIWENPAGLTRAGSSAMRPSSVLAWPSCRSRLGDASASVRASR